MSVARFLVDMLDRADAQLVAGWYHSVSVSTDRERARMRHEGTSFVDPTRDGSPTMGELALAAERIISQAATSAGAVSGLAGIAGAATVPPEVLGSVVATLRLGQRLCLLYGFDPHTDRGQMALCRALAAAYDVDLPAAGPVGMRVSDLPRLARPGSDPASVTAKLTRAVLVRSAWFVASRISRLIPVVSAASGAVESRRRTESAAQRMQDVLARLSDVPGSSRVQVEDAVEVIR